LAELSYFLDDDHQCLQSINSASVVAAQLGHVMFVWSVLSSFFLAHLPGGDHRCFNRTVGVDEEFVHVLMSFL